MKPTPKQAQVVICQLGSDKANASAEIARLRAGLARVIALAPDIEEANETALKVGVLSMRDEARELLGDLP